MRNYNECSFLCIFSTESGWDNPFRPGGDLSREADEIVNLIKGNATVKWTLKWKIELWILSFTGGKPITPTGELNLMNGNGLHEDMNGTTVVDGATKQEVCLTYLSIEHHP